MDFTSKAALITGAASGIGKATALTFAKYGASVGLADINTARLNETLNEVNALGAEGVVIPMDVTQKAAVQAGIDVMSQKYGKIDILVNCAGIVTSSFIVDLEEEVWDRVMDVNAKGVFLCCQLAARQMITSNYGKIVNISSIAAKTGEVGNGVYCASKAAVSLLTQTLALELAPHNITVNAVCPGYTETEIMQNVFLNRGPIEGMTPEQYKDTLLSNVPLKRMAKPEEIGELVAFLASDKSAYITGVAINIAGGKELH